MDVSVLTPTFKQAPFIARALTSLREQTLASWEAIVVDDGSPDDTFAAVEPFLADRRIRYVRLDQNVGLGAALNVGLEHARGRFVAYLPSDDVLFADHLASLVACLEVNPDAVLAYSGVKREERIPARGLQADFTTTGVPEGHPLQLVQVMHRLVPERWMERDELVTDDLERMYWSRLAGHGGRVGTQQITCEWVDHPLEHHRLIVEPLGGLNPYRNHYGVREPMRFQSSVGGLTDERAYYGRLELGSRPSAYEGLRILLLGELNFNAERVLALKERGCELFGLWHPRPRFYSTVGPLPFAGVTEIDRSAWRDEIVRAKPDVIYSYGNWGMIPFVHQVTAAFPDVPFAWHFKESPWDAIAANVYPELIALYQRANGCVFHASEMRDWVAAACPTTLDRPSLLMDGDLLVRGQWFADQQEPDRSPIDDDIHTVVTGKPLGMTPDFVADLAANGVHVHFYGDYYQRGFRRHLVGEALDRAPSHFHLHPQVDMHAWITELPQYDAGWLHLYRSENAREMARVTWLDLNTPTRIATYSLVGIPSIQRDNTDSISAQCSLALRTATGFVFEDAADLAEALRTERADGAQARAAWAAREQFTFEHHVDGFLAFLGGLATSALSA